MLSTQLKAQRIVNELEANRDSEMSVFNDSTGEDTHKSDKKFVPVGVRAWTLDEIYGNINPIYVDTLSHLYQNNSRSEGLTGHYNTLSNLASPRMSRIFMERPDMQTFFFSQPLDQFISTAENIRYYNTKSPYMNLSYNLCGSKTTGFDNFRAIYSQNIGRRINFGASFKYMYGQGYYGNQNTSGMETTAWGSYLGDRYDVHFYYKHNYHKMAENGGIQDEIYITAPEQLPSSYRAEDIPTNLSQAWSRQELHTFFLNHHYNLGFTRSDSDSIHGLVEEFVPVTRFFHTLKLQKAWRQYLSYAKSPDFHSYDYLPGDSTNDKTNHFYISNLVGVSLCEGFNKWAAFGINAYVGFEYMKFDLPDTMVVEGGLRSLRVTSRYSQNNTFVGAQIIRTMGKRFHFNINGRYVLAGSNFADFDINGNAEFNFPFLKDTLHLAASAYIKNLTPSFYFEHYHSKNAWWDEDFSKEWKMRVQGELSFPRSKTKVLVGFENIKNYSYFSNEGIINANGKVTNAIRPRQCGSMIQIFSATLKQDFRLGIFHFDNELTYQVSSNQEVLPLPALTTYHNLYLKFNIAKVLHTELGADMCYFTRYNAPDYSPVMGMFMNQNSQKTVSIGNYPLISAYANFALKKIRFYLQYYHVNQGTGRYFWAPYYPMNPGGLVFGLSWNFYD